MNRTRNKKMEPDLIQEDGACSTFSRYKIRLYSLSIVYGYLALSLGQGKKEAIKSKRPTLPKSLAKTLLYYSAASSITSLALISSEMPLMSPLLILSHSPFGTIIQASGSPALL